VLVNTESRVSNKVIALDIGSHRRRRTRTQWPKRNGTGCSNSDAVDAGSEIMENIQVHELK